MQRHFLIDLKKFTFGKDSIKICGVKHLKFLRYKVPTIIVDKNPSDISRSPASSFKKSNKTFEQRHINNCQNRFKEEPNQIEINIEETATTICQAEKIEKPKPIK